MKGVVGDEVGRFGSLELAQKARSDPKAHVPDLTCRGINQNIGWLHHESAAFCATRRVGLRDRRRSVRTASSPSALQGIDREFRRHGLRARASYAHVPRTRQGIDPPRLNPVHPSANIRALSFLALRALAASK